MSQRIRGGVLSIVGLALVFGAVATAWADIPVPGQRSSGRGRPAIENSRLVPLEIKQDTNSEYSILRIPKSLLPDSVQLGGDPEPTASYTRQTVAGGMILAAVVVGIVLRRKPSRAVKVALVLAVLAVGGLWVTAGYADLRIPEDEKPKHRIKIVIVDEGESVVLTRGKDFLKGEE